MKADYDVTMLCRVLGVSRSGFYEWRKREPSLRQREDERLASVVRAAFEESGRAYGSPRIHQELLAQGEVIGRRRVRRLMKEQTLLARKKPEFVTTTLGEHEKPVAPDLLRRDFTATRPNEKWVADITHPDIPRLSLSGDGARPVLSAHRRPRNRGDTRAGGRTPGPRHGALNSRTHRAADSSLGQGMHYTSNEYLRVLAKHSVDRSMSRKGNCWDNAPAESFFSSLKTELGEVLEGKHSPNDVRRAVIDYIANYNFKRRHSSIDYISPVDFEESARMDRAA
ncbi:MAG: IS3 family transposase [Myxococcaceae bacterium]